MRTKLIAVATTVAAAAAIGFAIASTSSTASETPPDYTKLTIDLSDAPRTKALAKPAPGSRRRPRSSIWRARRRRSTRRTRRSG